MTILIKGAKPYGEGAVDILIQDGRIAAIGDSLTVPGLEVVDAAGLPQVGVQVYQAGQGDQPGGVDDLGAGDGQVLVDGRDPAVGEQQVDGVLAVRARVLDDQAHSGAPPSSR